MPETKTLKIVHIVEGFTGGIITYLCSVLPRLAERGFDVTLICSLDRSSPRHSFCLQRLREEGITTYVISMERRISPLKDVKSLVGILKILLKNKFDVVHTHCSKAGVLGRAAAFLAGSRATVHSPHCFAFLRCEGHFRKQFFLILEKILGIFTTKLIAVSSSEADIAVCNHIVPAARCVQINNGLLNDEPRKHLSSPDRKFELDRLSGCKNTKQIVTTVCRLVEYKGVFRFLKAAELYRQKNALFLVAGEGEIREQVQKYIYENNLSEKVKLLGYVTETSRLYAISDVLAVCSDAEAQSYVILEAMRSRCPVVATSVTGNRDIISHEKTGLLVEPEPESIAAGIDELLSDAKKRRRYAENAYTYFCREHSVEKQVSSLAWVYRNCFEKDEID